MEEQRFQDSVLFRHSFLTRSQKSPQTASFIDHATKHQENHLHSVVNRKAVSSQWYKDGPVRKTHGKEQHILSVDD